MPVYRSVLCFLQQRLRSLFSFFPSLSHTPQNSGLFCVLIKKKQQIETMKIWICITVSGQPKELFLLRAGDGKCLQMYSKGYAIIMDLTFQFPHESNAFSHENKIAFCAAAARTLCFTKLISFSVEGFRLNCNFLELESITFFCTAGEFR
jgi:hypothetical protein